MQCARYEPRHARGVSGSGAEGVGLIYAALKRVERGRMGTRRGEPAHVLVVGA